MAITRHVAHIKSKALSGGVAKLPPASALTYGEIAINYSKNHETVSMKNEDDEIVYMRVPFVSGETLVM